jgi:hypothetical protein
MNQPGGIDNATALADFVAATARFPAMYPKPCSFLQWTGYLTAVGLAILTPAARYELTPIGRGFLRYLLDNRISPDRPF